MFNRQPETVDSTQTIRKLLLSIIQNRMWKRKTNLFRQQLTLNLLWPSARMPLKQSAQICKIKIALLADC